MIFRYRTGDAYVEEWYNWETDEVEPCSPRYDEDLDYANYDDFKGGLTEALRRMNPDYLNLRVTVENFGWRNTYAFTDIGDIDNAEDFISKVIPNCDWSMEGQWNEKEDFFTFTLFHHDSSTGEAWKVAIHDLTCKRCDGTGWLEVEDVECPDCDGFGEIGD